MDTVRDRLWIWGHDAGAHNEDVTRTVGCNYHLPKDSRMTPLEGACYLDVPNMIMIRFANRPVMPFDQYALALQPLERLYWGIVGAGGQEQTSVAEREHVLHLAALYPNIVGFFLDDFFHPADEQGNLGVLSLAQLREVRRQMAERLPERHLLLGGVVYTHQLDLPLQPYMDLFDHISMWTWNAPELDGLEANLARLERLAPHTAKLLGLYMWDYGLEKPMPLDKMAYQAETGLRWLREGRIDGMILLASCICDLELPAVEWTRDWVARVGDEPARR
jgi:hypothetical protein